MMFVAGGSLMDFLVLAVLNHEDTYGYVLTQRVKTVMEISDSTLYPVLRRLMKDGMLTTYDQSFQGRNRRYYSITDAGREQLAVFTEEWEHHKAQVDFILGGGIRHD